MQLPPPKSRVRRRCAPSSSEAGMYGSAGLLARGKYFDLVDNIIEIRCGVRLGFGLHHENDCHCRTHHTGVTRSNAQEASCHQTEHDVQNSLRPLPQKLLPSSTPILSDQPCRTARCRGPRMLAARPTDHRERREFFLKRTWLAGTHNDLSWNGCRRPHRSDERPCSSPPLASILLLHY